MRRAVATDVGLRQAPSMAAGAGPGNPAGVRQEKATRPQRLAGTRPADVGPASVEAVGGLGAGEQRPAVGEAVQPAVDRAGDRRQVVAVGQRVDAVLGPVPARHPDAEVEVARHDLGRGQDILLAADRPAVAP